MMISDLPLDLESEILSRVPATSLSQLRSTCRRWYALFKDPRFVKKNLGKAAAQLIFIRGPTVYSCIINLHEIHNNCDPTFEITGKLNDLKDSKLVKVSEIFQCNGLLLFSTLYGDRLVVWNPCTGQTRRIKSNKHCIVRCNYFLGYENSCDSYKILRFSYIIYVEDQKDVAVSKIEIYEFNSDSWRLVDEVMCERDWYFTFYLSGDVSLKGNTYWFDGNYKKHHPVSSIVVFDFTTERLGRLALPFQSDGDETVVLSAVKEEKLALLRCDKHSLAMKIWVTNTKIDEAKDLSWSVLLVVDLRKACMITPTVTSSFLVDEENKLVVVCCGGDRYNAESMGIYIVGENMDKRVYFRLSLSYAQSHLLSYVPSLVHIQQHDAKENFSRYKITL